MRRTNPSTGGSSMPGSGCSPPGSSVFITAPMPIALYSARLPRGQAATASRCDPLSRILRIREPRAHSYRNGWCHVANSVLCQVVELAGFRPGQECRNLGASVNQRRSGGVARVADSDLAVWQRRDFDTGAARVAGLALSPRHPQLASGYPVFDWHLTLSP